MNNYENLDKIHDAVVDWDESFVLDLKPEVEYKAVLESNWGMFKDKPPIVTHNGRSYYVSERGHLWPI